MLFLNIVHQIVLKTPKKCVLLFLIKTLKINLLKFSSTNNKKFIQDTNAAKIFYDEVANILERATVGVLCKNALLYFAYADFEEGRLKYEKVHQIYNKLIAINDIDPTLVINPLIIN